MSWLFRPSILALVSTALALSAAFLVFAPLWEGQPQGRAMPLPVPEGDQEVVWLNPATSAVTWDRFVAAVRRVQAEFPELGLDIDEQRAFPRQTTAVPELALRVPQKSGRLWIRWYKLTADLRIPDWVAALSSRQPPPLAIVGGGSSDRARDLAYSLQDAASRLGPARPLLLITTATADQVASPEDPSVSVALSGIYPDHTFRFCFTNEQMAEAAASFVWSRDDLRPDAEPVYVVAWQDDPYSEDLADRFRAVLWSEPYRASLQRRQALRAGLHTWLWLTGRLGTGGIPPGLACEGIHGNEQAPAFPFWRARIPYSVGGFSQPNRPEAEMAEKLMDELSRHPAQRRPLLVLPAGAQPARRFLRGLMRIAPAEAERFVVVTGDSIDFNTIYRDRNLTWPIQDLPYDLVLFCHRNPVDQFAFRPADGSEAATGTEDLLLFADLVEAVVRGAFAGDVLAGNASTLAANLRAAEPARFDAAGNRAGGGEYLVHLEPVRHGERILPRACLRVYSRSGGMGQWTLVRELPVDYERVRSGGVGP